VASHPFPSVPADNLPRNPEGEWNRLSFGQIRSNYISPFRYKKTPENLDFPGFLNHFDIVRAVDYLLDNSKRLFYGIF
jgi:hypothetical protein